MLGQGRAILPLARVEGRLLLRNLSFLLGPLAVLFMIGVGTTADPRRLAFAFISFGVFGLAFATLVAAHHNLLRSRRDRTEDLYGATPTSPEERTAAHLLGLVSAVLATCAAVVVAAFVVGPPSVAAEIVEARSMDAWWVTAAQGPLLVGALGALGVAIARWFPYRGTGIVAAVVLFLFGGTAFWSNSRARWFLPFASSGGGPSEANALMAWHFVYLAGLAGVFGAIALFRHGRSRLASRTGLAGGLLFAVGGLAQLVI